MSNADPTEGQAPTTQSDGTDSGTGNPNRERPDVPPAQVSDEAVSAHAVPGDEEDEGAYAEE